MARFQNIIVATLAVAFWLSAVGTGLWFLLRYELTPGSVAAAADPWPADTQLALDAMRPTLVMFVHPGCPCSRASLSELGILMSRFGGDLSCLVVLRDTAAVGRGQGPLDLAGQARAIPGVEVVWDRSGHIAAGFGAATSGETLLYAASGQLLFHGGITRSRGHQGSNSGRAALEQLLGGATQAEPQSAAVYGCCLEAKQ